MCIRDRNQPVTIKHPTRRGRQYSWDTKYEGVIANLNRRYKNTESDHTRQDIERYMAAKPCPDCNGKRLNPEALAVKVCGIGIMDVTAKNIGDGLNWVKSINSDPLTTNSNKVLSDRNKIIANQILKEIEGRLAFLDNIGPVSYTHLTLPTKA